MKVLSQLAVAIMVGGYVFLSSGCVVAARPAPAAEARDERWCTNHPRECDHDRWCADHPNECGR